MQRAYQDAYKLMLWYQSQFAEYSAEQAIKIEAGSQTDESRAAFGMLWRAKEWMAEHGRLAEQRGGLNASK